MIIGVALKRAIRQGGDVKMANHMALPASNNTHAKPDEEKAILCMGRMNVESLV